MKRTVLWIVDRLDRGDCRRCGAPAEELHSVGCWRALFDGIRAWAAEL